MTTLRKIDMAGAGACVAITALGYVFVAEPMVERATAREAAQAQLAEQRALAEEAEASLVQLRKDVSQLEQAVEAEPLSLQPLDRLNARLAQIAATAAEAGVELDQLEPGRPAADRHYMTVPIRVAGKGGYAASSRFVHQLHEQMPDTAVASVDLNGRARGRATAGAFRLELVWHAAPTPAAAKPAATASAQ